MNRSIRDFAEEQTSKRSRIKKYPVVPAGIVAKLPRLSNIAAVLWDVYGTLLGRPMGDLSGRSFIEKNMRQAFRETAREFGLNEFLDGDPTVVLRQMYAFEIERVHCLKRDRGIFSPEVKIERVWLRILKKLEARGYKPESGQVDLEMALKAAYFFDDVEYFKVLYPGAKQALEAIRKRGLRQGIISNAQFYTPLTLNILLRDSEDAHDEPVKRLFDRGLIFFSYQLGVGKPNLLPFEKARDRLMRLGINPDRVLYVGNDMLYDMVSARRVGFKAVLFVGDRRSLTLRKDDPEAAEFEPDAVIKSLTQILGIIGDNGRIASAKIDI
jgi:putative hydrolase of the HAD superfamily